MQVLAGQREQTRLLAGHAPSAAKAYDGKQPTGEQERTSPMSPDASVQRPSEILAAHRDEVLRIARKYHADDVRVFGSIARGADTSASDIDLLVRFDEDASLFDLNNMQDELTGLLHVGVDLVSEAALNGRGLRIAAEAIPL